MAEGPVFWNQMTWQEIAALTRTMRAIILPVGAVEQYSPTRRSAQSGRSLKRPRRGSPRAPECRLRPAPGATNALGRCQDMGAVIRPACLCSKLSVGYTKVPAIESHHPWEQSRL